MDIEYITTLISEPRTLVTRIHRGDISFVVLKPQAKYQADAGFYWWWVRFVSFYSSLVDKFVKVILCMDGNVSFQILEGTELPDLIRNI